ncbi:alpha/beta hydrolase family protein [Jannaschia pohangensis]|uniref:Dienelactone hydrolase domain-containing protein n=1 Tax=Jannaschia pohangensis TaxID=390807 RepID=A0A1I3MCE7_9RHOB|nr:hypothetical protein [Jannaschia pohangensis]SFI94651.1 hypothetical protein SAMN04488095_1801 [Jannaschia pohangensis]
MNAVRLASIVLFLGLLVYFVPPILAARGINVPDPFRMGPDLDGLPQVARLAEPERPTARRFTQSATTDLTSFTVDTDYRPDPTQGERYRTENGTAWWGAAPSGPGPHPVVFLMHGAGRDGHSMIDMWYETAMEHGIVLVAPDFDSVPGWNTSFPDPRSASDVLDHAATMHDIDPDRIYLFGHSRGAIGAQVWANRFEGPWRAVAVHAGTLTARNVGPVENGLPIRHYLGSSDRIFPFGEAIEGGAAMAAAGHPFELVRLEGHNHWFYERGEDIAAHAWQWLARQGG